MDKDNSKNKRVIVIVISIIILLALVLAISYAYFSTELSGTEQIVKVGTLDLVLNETSEGISLDNSVGLSDSNGMSLTPSTFELINNGSKAVDYTIYLDDNTISDTDTRIDDKYLKYNLNKNGADSGATLLTRIGANPNRILDSGTIEGGETNTYSLNLWITSDVDGNYSGQVFSGKLRVEVSQEREKEVATVLLNNLPEDNINTTDPDQTFIVGTNPNNYIWYSGKLWRAVSIDTSDNSVKLVTQWTISAISYDDNSSAFEGSYMEEWLNDTTVDGFLGNLRQPEKFIKMDSKWNASEMSDTNKPPSEEEGGTIAEDAVGLLNYYEYMIVGSLNSYLNVGLHWWTLTPASESSVRVITNTGNYTVVHSPSAGNCVRPSINLKSTVEIVSGNGTVENPYRLKGDKDTSLSGTLLNTRYSGEYITFGTGENNLYRIVSHETEGLTKITSAEPLKNEGTFITTSLGNINYSDSTTMGAFLNGEYLTSGVYLTNEQVSMIEESTTWYYGTIGQGQNYKLAKYIDANMIDYAISTDVKVGLLRFGELMAGQFNKTENNQEYWTITPNANNIAWNVSNYGTIKINGSTFYKFGIKPAFNLKSNVIITSGDGTLQNPFQIELAS